MRRIPQPLLGSAGNGARGLEMAKLRFIAMFRKQAEDGPEEELASLFSIAQSLTPRAEAIRAGESRGLVLEATARGEKYIWDSLSARSDLHIGAASTRTAAILAALESPGCAVLAGRERSFLAPIPIESLSLLCEDWDRQASETLARWGIATLGQLAALPRDELSARLGPGGIRLQKLARGQDLQVFRPYRPPVDFEAERDLEWALDSLEPLSFLLSGLLEDLCGRLRSQALAADEVTVRLKLEGGERFERTLRLPFPMSSAKTLLSLLRLDLQERPPQANILAVALSIAPTRPRTLQYSLLQEAAPDPEKLSRTLARLTALVGEKNLGRPVVLDTHRPDAVRLQPLRLEERRRSVKRAPAPPSVPSGSRLTLRRMRPPRPVRIRRQEVAACAGPWRTSGDWWDGDLERNGWSRDEWDLELRDGSICRVFWDYQERGWFLEGIYD